MELKNFMMIFRFNPNTPHQPTDKELSEQHQNWAQWIGGIAAQAKLVSTNQLGFEGKQITADGAVLNNIYSQSENTVGGNMVVRTTTINDAVNIAKGCPILEMGGHVEVRDIIPMNS